MSQDSPWSVVLCSSLLFALSASSASSASAQALRFATHKDYSSGYGAAAIAVGDLNGDGVRDLAVANNFDGTVAVLLGNPDGTFQPARIVYLGPNNQPKSAALADFNRDGKLDLAVANPAANTVTILPGNGDGSFQPRIDFLAGESPRDIAIADFDGDAKPDLAVANGDVGHPESSKNYVSVLLNKCARPKREAVRH